MGPDVDVKHRVHSMIEERLGHRITAVRACPMDHRHFSCRVSRVSHHHLHRGEGVSELSIARTQVGHELAHGSPLGQFRHCLDQAFSPDFIKGGVDVHVSDSQLLSQGGKPEVIAGVVL